VTLTLAASSDHGTISDMCFSSGGVTYGDWQSYAQSVPYSLSAGDGIKTVCAVFRDSSGLVSPVAGAIVGVDTHKPLPHAYAASVVRDKTATLRYLVSDAASPYVWQTVTIRVKNSHGKLVKQIVRKNQATAKTLTWKFRCTLARGTYKYYVYATDAAGNYQSHVASARFIVR